MNKLMVSHSLAARFEQSCNKKKALFILVLLGVLNTGYATDKLGTETSDAASNTDNTSPKINIPDFESPLATFRFYEDVDAVPWKEANDKVGEIGGWRTYAREVYEAQKKEAAAKKEKMKAETKEKTGDSK